MRNIAATDMEHVIGRSFNELEIIERYTAGYKDMATIYIAYDSELETAYYIVDEPQISTPEAESLYNMLVRMLETSNEVLSFYGLDFYERQRRLEELIYTIADEAGLGETLQHHPEVLYTIIRNVAGWREIDVPMRDKNVEEIDAYDYRKPVRVVIRKNPTGQMWIPTNIVFMKDGKPSDDALLALVRVIASRTGKQVSVATPIVEARSPEGYRIFMGTSEADNTQSSFFTIRKFPENPLTIVDLISREALTPLMAAYLWILISNKRFVVYMGEMGSGKTTFLQSSLAFVPWDNKIVVIEDVPEIRVPHPHIQYLYTRRSPDPSQNISLEDLVVGALRSRAQYIIIGEVRSKEMAALVQAAATGHGSMTTFHASDPDKFFLRIKSPPISVEPAFMLVISTLVYLSPVLVPGTAKTVRKVFRVWEITSKMRDTDYGKMPGAELIFWFDQGEFRFKPDDPYEVVRKSERLKEIGRDIYGEQYAVECMVWDLEQRAESIKYMVENREFFSSFETIARGIMIRNIELKKSIRECPAMRR
ncbi:MAG: type II/IV secretion system ATPase subunit [Sulfolobales archaeon]